MSMILMAAGMFFKVAAVPFHMWAPDAYEGAPTSITAFMSVGVKAASFAMFGRLFLYGLPDLRGSIAGDAANDIPGLPGWAVLLGIVSAITIVWGNLGALTQNNTKRLLAYSSISHAGYTLLGLIAGNQTGYTGFVIYLFIYTIMNLGVFGCIIALRRRGIVGDRMEDLNGLMKKAPWLTVMMTIFLLSLGGIPPTAGFIGKFYLFAGLDRDRQSVARAIGDTGGADERGVALLLHSFHSRDVHRRRDRASTGHARAFASSGAGSGGGAGDLHRRVPATVDRLHTKSGHEPGAEDLLLPARRNKTCRAARRPAWRECRASRDRRASALRLVRIAYACTKTTNEPAKSEKPRAGGGISWRQATATVGLALAIPWMIGVPALIGWWVDKKYATSPLWLIVGLALGLLSTALDIYQLLKRFGQFK